MFAVIFSIVAIIAVISLIVVHGFDALRYIDNNKTFIVPHKYVYNSDINRNYYLEAVSYRIAHKRG